MRKLLIEVVRDFDNSYYANVSIDSQSIYGLPEYVTYRELKKAIKEAIGYTLPNVADLKFEKPHYSRKCYAYIETFI